MTRASIMVLLTPLLAACAVQGNTEGDFLTPAQTGRDDVTIAEADQGGSAVKDVRYEVAPGSAPSASNRTDRPDLRSGPQPVMHGGATRPVPDLVAAGDGRRALDPVLFREPEQLSSVWIAPYVDADGNMHQPGYVHFVVRPGSWRRR